MSQNKYIFNTKGGLQKTGEGLKKGVKQLSTVEKTLTKGLRPLKKGGLPNIQKQDEDDNEPNSIKLEEDNKLPYKPIPGYGFHRNDVKKEMVNLVKENKIKGDIYSYKNVRKQAIDELTKKQNKLHGFE